MRRAHRVAAANQVVCRAIPVAAPTDAFGVRRVYGIAWFHVSPPRVQTTCPRGRALQNRAAQVREDATMCALRVAWVVYGSFNQVSGGYIYVRLVVEQLRALGDQV